MHPSDMSAQGLAKCVCNNRGESSQESCLRERRGRIFQQREAQVLFDGSNEALGVPEHGAAVFQEDLDQLQCEHL